MKKDYLYIMFIVCITGFIMFYRLGAIPLLDPDEPVYAQTAVEMLESNDFISPQIYGGFWYDKPPMYYWLTAVSIFFLGNTEFAARLPSAIFAIFTVILVFIAGKKMFSRRAGLFAALILATSIEFFYLGKAAVTDITLTFFFSLTLLAYADKRYKLMYIAMACAVLTKGPVAIALPMAIVGCHCFSTKEYEAIKASKIFYGFIIVCSVAGPWYGLMSYLHGNDFIQTFIGYHNITRFLQPEHESGTKLYYYLPVLLIGFFPWSIYLLQAIKESLYNFKNEYGKLLQLLIIWVGVVLIFFSLSQTKLVSYILPLYPALALLTGWYLDKIVLNNQWQKLRSAIVILIAFSSIIIIELFMIAKTYLNFMSMQIFLLNSCLVIMVVLVAYAARNKNLRFYIGSLIGGMILFVTVLMQMVLPMAAEFVSTKDQAVTFQKIYTDKSIPVYIDKFYRPGFCFYSGTAGIELKDPLENLLTTDRPAYFLVKKDKYINLAKEQQEGIVVLKEEKEKVMLYKKS